jgi:hypothetical protein
MATAAAISLKPSLLTAPAIESSSSCRLPSQDAA